MIPKLDPRLQAVADGVRPGSRVADIGCDHGLVVAHLILRGICPSAIAGDVAEGPLQAARETVERLGVPNVRLVLGDGLALVDPDAVDDVVIAGMGGELIAAILDRAPGFHRADKCFVLQPMSRLDELRSYLVSNGFAIERETAVIAQAKPYSVMTCAFTGERRTCPPAYRYIGELAGATGEAALWLLRRERDRLSNKLRGNLAAPEADSVCAIIHSIDLALSGGDPYGT